MMPRSLLVVNALFRDLHLQQGDDEDDREQHDRCRRGAPESSMSNESRTRASMTTSVDPISRATDTVSTSTPLFHAVTRT